MDANPKIGSSTIIWNPFTPGYFEDPYPHLKACRMNNPVQLGVHNHWVIFNYSDVRSIIRSINYEVSEISSYFKSKEPYIFNKLNQCPYLSKGTELWPMYLNGEIHKRIRVAMGRAINSTPINETIEESLGKLNKHFENQSSIDLVDYCSHFIFFITKKLFGIGEDVTIEQIRKYSNSLARSQDLFVPKQVYLDINTAFIEGKKYFPASSFKEMLKSTLADLDLPEDGLYSVMSIILMASFETSKDNLSLALFEILKKKELIDPILNSNPSELNVLIEELFRFTSPLQYTVRINKEPITINDKQIEADSKLYLCLASANRDDTVFLKPDTIDLFRTNNDHLSFGGGTHFCLGASLARIEMRHCLKSMLKFLQHFEISKNQHLKWSKQIFMRTIKSISLERRM